MWNKVTLKCWLLYILCEVGIVENLQSASYNRHSTGYTIVSDTADYNAVSKIDCGRECTSRSECHIFYYRRSSKSCKVVTNYNYIDFFQTGTEQYDLYHVDSEPAVNPRHPFRFVSTSLPLVFCSSGDQIFAISNDGSTLTFRVIIDAVSQSDAWNACINNGQRLMKIDTGEKQALVAQMLSDCPAFHGHDYWIDGYKHDTDGWIYTDGSNVPMNSTHLWASYAPNNSGRTCIRMRYDVGYRWDDYRCEEGTFGYICEQN